MISVVNTSLGRIDQMMVMYRLRFHIRAEYMVDGPSSPAFTVWLPCFECVCRSQGFSFPYFVTLMYLIVKGLECGIMQVKSRVYIGFPRQSRNALVLVAMGVLSVCASHRHHTHKRFPTLAAVCLRRPRYNPLLHQSHLLL